jgi:hypothetical protein
VIEDDSSVDPRTVADAERFDEAVLYDFAKFVTTLSLFALGGLLTLIQTADRATAKPPVVAFIVGAVALAGICGVGAASRIAKVGKPSRRKGTSPQTMLLIAIAFLGLGAGGFLMLWWKTL